MSLDDLAARDMAKIAERNALATALRYAQSEYGGAMVEAARAMPKEREAAFQRVRELEEKVEKARLALEEYDQAAMKRDWPA